MAPTPRLRDLVIVLVTAAFGVSCGLNRVERRLAGYNQTATLDSASPYLKVHLKNGHVYVLSDWATDTASALVTGTGDLLDPNRVVIDSGQFRVPLDSVALFETNVLRGNSTKTALTVMAGITAAVAGICAASPKTCFGSCPTFYTSDDQLAAEGFSASIAPALEATDLDMLPRARPRSRDFTLRMTNEALETHVVRWADLLVAVRPAGGRVFVTPQGIFRAVSALIPPSRCTAAEGDCAAAVATLDSHERSSLADSTDLATRETIELEFPSTGAKQLGLIITARQTLLTTFLIYQSLAYMGHDASGFLAALETHGPLLREQARGLGQALGRIEVIVDGVVVGAMGETGPLAADTKVVPLPATVGNASQITLRLTRGLWRLDYLALAQLGDSVPMQRIPPSRVLHAGRDDRAAVAALRDSARVLTTLPGDAYQIVYRLPPNPEQYELFLEARGYYLEWMRREWFAEQNRTLALGMLFDAPVALRGLAPAYKRIEPEIERLFWSSRFATR